MLLFRWTPDSTIEVILVILMSFFQVLVYSFIFGILVRPGDPCVSPVCGGWQVTGGP